VKSDEEQAKLEISVLLERSRKAYEALDFSAVRQVFPSAPESLRSQFGQYASVAITASGPPLFRELDQTTALVELAGVERRSSRTTAKSSAVRR
jgi:hypothetical protein